MVHFPSRGIIRDMSIHLMFPPDRHAILCVCISPEFFTERERTAHALLRQSTFRNESSRARDGQGDERECQRCFLPRSSSLTCSGSLSTSLCNGTQRVYSISFVDLL